MRTVLIAVALFVPPERAAEDQYPDDPFAFGCSYDVLIDPHDPDPADCAMMLATCADAQVSSCQADQTGKACVEALEQCWASVQSSCFAHL